MLRFAFLLVAVLALHFLECDGSLWKISTFLSELTRMFQKARTTGSVVLTMKRYDGRTTPKVTQTKTPSGHHHHHEEFKCLIRATLGNRKISSVVNPKDVNKFQQAYASLLKGNMDGLKKRDKKTAKAKATQ